MLNEYPADFRFHQSTMALFKLIKNTGGSARGYRNASRMRFFDMDSEQTTGVCAPIWERKANFSDEEVKVLLELYQQHFHVLNSKFSSAITQKKKTAVWADIATAVSSSGHAVRTMMDVRRSNAYEEMEDKETLKLELEHKKLVLECRVLEQKEQIGLLKIKLLTRKLEQLG